MWYSRRVPLCKWKIPETFGFAWTRLFWSSCLCYWSFCKSVVSRVNGRFIDCSLVVVRHVSVAINGKPLWSSVFQWTNRNPLIPFFPNLYLNWRLVNLITYSQASLSKSQKQLIFLADSISGLSRHCRLQLLLCFSNVTPSTMIYPFVQPWGFWILLKFVLNGPNSAGRHPMGSHNGRVISSPVFPFISNVPLL